MRMSPIVSAANGTGSGNRRIIRGPCFVTRDVRLTTASVKLYRYFCVVVPIRLLLEDADVMTPSLQNIDTDQIIPAEYLTLVPSKVHFQYSITLSPSACRCVLAESAPTPQT